MRLRYGDADRSQLVEYVHGADDVEWVIGHLVARLPAEPSRIVHVGCGLGWLTHEMKRQRPSASILGTDPSGSAIALATELFGSKGLDFRAGDLPAAAADEPSADALVVSASSDALDERSRDRLVHMIALHVHPGCPIFVHLHRSSSAEGDDDLVAQLATATGTHVALPLAAARAGSAERFAVLEWSIGAAGTTEAPRPPVQLEPQRRRADRVAARLGIRVTHDAYLLPNGEGSAVLVVSPLRNAPSETFIRAQIEGLPTRVEALWGDAIGRLEDEDGLPLTPPWARSLGRLLAILGPRWPARVDRYFLYRFLVRRRVALVVAIYGPTGVLWRSICERRSLPLVTEFMGFDASERAVLEAFESQYRRLLAGEAATIAVSREIERRLVGLGAPPDSVHWIPCGVDFSRFSATNAALNPPVFLAAGRFVEKKAPHLTLLAFSRLLSDVPEARLRMVGGGPLLDACVQLARALNVQDSVEFLGYRSHEELAVLMTGARAFVQHSVVAPSGDSEGTPVAILEAGAAGLPVIATRHGGIPDTVIDGETGFLVEEGDVSAMADRMRTLANDPALAGRMGTQATAHIHARFDQRDTIAQLWAVLHSAMAGDRSR